MSHCINCGNKTNGGALCQECASKKDEVSVKHCHNCGKPSARYYCKACEKKKNREARK